MKRIVLVSTAVVAALTAGAPLALAGSDTLPKVALHLAAKPAKATYCDLSSPITLAIPCSEYNVHGLTKPDIVVDQVIYLVVAQVDTPYTSGNVAGLTCGIEYDGDLTEGVDMTSWLLCADGQEYTNAGPRGLWPASGGGNVMTFTTCQETRVGTDGTHALLGAFLVYAYSNDKFKITPNRNFLGPDVLLVANCAASEMALDTTGVANGWVGFGTDPGCNPCLPGLPGKCATPVKPTTWGRIKATY